MADAAVIIAALLAVGYVAGCGLVRVAAGYLTDRSRRDAPTER